MLAFFFSQLFTPSLSNCLVIARLLFPSMGAVACKVRVAEEESPACKVSIQYVWTADGEWVTLTLLGYWSYMETFFLTLALPPALTTASSPRVLCAASPSWPLKHKTALFLYLCPCCFGVSRYMVTDGHLRCPYFKIKTYFRFWYLISLLAIVSQNRFSSAVWVACLAAPFLINTVTLPCALNNPFLFLAQG